MEEDEFRRLAELVREIAEKVCLVKFAFAAEEGENEDFQWWAEQKVCRLCFGPAAFINDDRGYPQLEPVGCRMVEVQHVRLTHGSDFVVNISWQEILVDDEYEGITHFSVQGMTPEQFLPYAIAWKLRYL